MTGYDRVPREVVWWGLKIIRVDKWLMQMIMKLYFTMIQERVSVALNVKFTVC